MEVGAIGDFYFHLSSISIYGPKTDSGWGTPVSLKGAKGDKGDDGTANVIATQWLKGIDVNHTSTYGTREYRIGGDALDALLETGATSLHDFLLSKGGTLLVYATDTNFVISQASVGSLPREVRYKASVLSSDYHVYNIQSDWILNASNSNSLFFRYTYVKSVPALSSAPNIAPILNLRFVLIPAGKLLSANRNMNGKNINWEDLSYEEVKALLELED